MKQTLFNTIYDQILEHDPDAIKMSRIADAQIAEAVRSYSGIMDSEQLEAMSDKFVDAVNAAMHEAYKTGARHCLKLIYETLTD